MPLNKSFRGIPLETGTTGEPPKAGDPCAAVVVLTTIGVTIGACAVVTVRFCWVPNREEIASLMTADAFPAPAVSSAGFEAADAVPGAGEAGADALATAEAGATGTGAAFSGEAGATFSGTAGAAFASDTSSDADALVTAGAGATGAGAGAGAGAAFSDAAGAAFSDAARAAFSGAAGAAFSGAAAAVAGAAAAVAGAAAAVAGAAGAATEAFVCAAVTVAFDTAGVFSSTAAADVFLGAEPAASFSLIGTRPVNGFASTMVRSREGSACSAAYSSPSGRFVLNGSKDGG